MPLAPYAKLGVSVNGGAVQTGGITVPASATIQLTADPSASVGAFQYKYEIYGYPNGFACPSGWSTDSNGVYFYSSGPTPPIFTLPTIANWGKFMLRLTLNNAVSSNTKAIPPAQLIDEKTAVSILSPTGLADVGIFESNQFGNTWVAPVQAALRATDAATTAVSNANTKAPAQLLATSNVTISGEQTIDGVLTSASRVLLIAQSTSSQNGLWVTGAGAWTRPSDFATDAQVVVGQTVFITSGSLNAHTNWQLVSGSTIAGAKSYSQLVSGGTGGASGILPVDAVDTTNNAKTGTSSVDGVTLTANSSRVLLVNQTTSSENGPWLVQVGAWTRPSDFTLDSQVIQGTQVYVKGGVLGSGTNWQLTSGTTISGAKKYQRIAPMQHPPVRCVQTGALPSYTYNSGTLTFTATANGVIPTTVFDGVTPALGDSFLLTTDGATNTHVGPVTITQLGDASNPWILQRRSDGDSSADFVQPMAFDVYDGATALTNSNKGTRWQLVTQGVVTMDTTPLSFAKLGNSNAAYIDLSQPPYSMFNDLTNTIDQTNALLRFAYDARVQAANTGTPVNGILPPYNMIIDQTVPFWSNTGLVGLSPDNTLLRSRFRGGGYALVFGHTGQPIAIDTSTPIDTYTINGLVNRPWYPADTTIAQNDAWINITADGGLMFWNLRADDNHAETGWTAFQIRMNLRPRSFPSSGQLHLMSCRNKRLSDEASTNLFTLLLGVGGALQATVRLWDKTTGVYGSTTSANVGGGTATVTGDATVKPATDCTIVVYVDTGGTVGTAGIKLRISVNGGAHYHHTAASALALGTATSLQLDRFNGFPDPFLAKLNFGAGTLVAGATYTIVCSGTINTYTLTLPADVSKGLAIGTASDLILQYDSATGNIDLYCSRFLATGSQQQYHVTQTGAHGVFIQYAHETTMLGCGANGGEEFVDIRAADVAIGGLTISSGGVAAPPATTVTHLPAPTGQRFYWTPGLDPFSSASNELYEWGAGGAGTGSMYGWYGNREGSYGTYGKNFLYERRNAGYNSLIPQNIRASGFTVFAPTALGTGAPGGMLHFSCSKSYFADLSSMVIGEALRISGPSFATTYEGKSNWQAVNGRAIVGCNGGVALTGLWWVFTSVVLVQSQQFGFDVSGQLFINPGASTRECMLLDGNVDTDSHFRLLVIDGEELNGTAFTDTLLRVYVRHNRRAILGGIITAAFNLPISYHGDADGTLDLSTYPMLLVSGRSCGVEYTSLASRALEVHPHTTCTDGGVNAVPLSNNGKLYVRGKGREPNGADILSTDTTLHFTDGRFRLMQDSTTTGAQSIALDATGMSANDVWEISVGVQANNVTFTGLPSNFVISAGRSGIFKFALAGDQLGSKLKRVG